MRDKLNVTAGDHASPMTPETLTSHTRATIWSVSNVPPEPGVGVLPEKLGGGVRPASQNPYSIYDQNLRYSIHYL